MTSNRPGPTLTDAVGMGGVNAQDGFDYQIWEGLIRLPALLKNPAFEAVIFEGLEDIEARFFAPQAPEGRLLERCQAKSGSLSRQDVKEVFGRFLEFERAHPRIARVQTLVTPQLPATLRWVAKDGDRVRNARPFYAPFERIQDASDAELTGKFISAFGDELGSFAATGVEVTERVLASRDTAIAAFAVAFANAFPSLDPGQRALASTFDQLEGLGRRSKGVPVFASDLKALLQEVTSHRLFPKVFRLHVRSDRNGKDESALEFDASAFSGGDNGYPPPLRWREEMSRPLETTATWLRERATARIRLSGSYRLTTAFLLGYAFRAATGFELEIPTRSGQWNTDDRPTGREQSWTVHEATGVEGETLVVSVGSIRNPAEALRTMGIPSSHILEVQSADPLVDGSAAQAAVAVIKGAVTGAASHLGAKAVDLYFVGPAALAVCLGHRWNAMPPTRLFEFDAKAGAYVPSARLE